MKFGKVNEYIGMELDYSEEGIVKIPMINYLNNVLRELSEHLGTPASSPASDHIFKVGTDSEAKYQYLTK